MTEIVPIAQNQVGEGAVQTMTSLEIAELTGKQHKDVMRDIRNMLESLEIDSAQFCAQYKDARGRIQHKAVIQLVRNYQSDLEEFGRVTFEMAPFETAGGTQQREIAILNERQATLILSYMRNTEIVRTFKKQLVTTFYKMADELQKQAKQIEVPQTLPEALRLAADLAEKNSKLAHEVEKARPRGGRVI